MEANKPGRPKGSKNKPKKTNDLKTPRKSPLKDKGNNDTLDTINMVEIEDDKPKGNRRWIPEIPVSGLIEYRLVQKLSTREIAAKYKCDHATIARRLREYRIDGTPGFAKNKELVFTSLQYRLIESISDSDIKKMATRDRFMGIGILQDKIDKIQGNGSDRYPTMISLQVVGQVIVNTGEIGQVSYQTIDIAMNKPTIDENSLDYSKIEDKDISEKER